MIRNLYIRNFVLIDEVNLEFEKGFSSFTGETGAGKSIMIDAISLLAAERASSSFVGIAVPISIPLYICRESADIIGQPKCSAMAKLVLVLPTAVGPISTTRLFIVFLFG